MLDALLGGIGSIASGLFGKSQAKQQANLQREFAKKGIQWKVADAKKAGVHPLAALGANTISYSPVSVGTPDFGAVGQDIGRAIDAGSTANQRASSLSTRLLEAQIRGQELDNNGKQIQNAALASETVRRSQVGPPMASLSGATNTGVAGQATSKSSGLRLGSSGALPSFPGSASNDMGNAFGELLEDFAGAVNFRDSMSKMSANQKGALLQAVFPGFQWSAMQLGRKYRPPANYGPRVTTKSFRDTFQ